MKTLSDWIDWYEKFFFHSGKHTSGPINCFQGLYFSILEGKHPKGSYKGFNELWQFYEKRDLFAFKGYDKEQMELLSCLKLFSIRLKETKKLLEELKDQSSKRNEIASTILLCGSTASIYGGIYLHNLLGLMALSNEFESGQYTKFATGDVRTTEHHKYEINSKLKRLEYVEKAGELTREESAVDLLNFWQWQITKQYLV
ncbi:MAG: hypothetical protein ABIG20_02495 [archaeon]